MAKLLHRVEREVVVDTKTIRTNSLNLGEDDVDSSSEDGIEE